MLLGVVLVLSSVPRPGLEVVAEAFGVERVELIRQLNEPSLEEVRARTEFVASTLAMSWLVERSFGCQAFVREESDGALAAAELLDLAASLGSPRASRWAYWALYGRWLHAARFRWPSRAIAEELDAFVEHAVRGGRAEERETEWAALLAIETWEGLARER